MLGSILRGFRECLLPVLKQCQKLQLQRFDTPTGALSSSKAYTKASHEISIEEKLKGLNEILNHV